MERRTLGSLFHPEPPQWGLRGDPGLWDELARRFADTPLPTGFGDLWQMLEAAYVESVGQALTDPHSPNIARFNRGGMSQGAVSPEHWAKTLFPLISARFAACLHSSSR